MAVDVTITGPTHRTDRRVQGARRPRRSRIPAWIWRDTGRVLGAAMRDQVWRDRHRLAGLEPPTRQTAYAYALLVVHEHILDSRYGRCMLAASPLTLDSGPGSTPSYPWAPGRPTVGEGSAPHPSNPRGSNLRGHCAYEVTS